LSLIEDLAYRRLLDTYYTEEKPLPTDAHRCARLIAMPEHADAVDLVLNEFFTLTDDGWMNERCDDEIEKYHHKAQSARNANAKRWQSKPDLKTDQKSDADQIATNNHKPKPKKDTPAPDGAFDEFWSAYPKKIGKHEAAKSWAKVGPNTRAGDHHPDSLVCCQVEPRLDEGRWAVHPSRKHLAEPAQVGRRGIGRDQASGGLAMSNLAHGAEAVWELRVGGKKPTEIVFISMVGYLNAGSYAIFAPEDDPTRYDWRWVPDLSTCIVYGNSSNGKQLSALMKVIVRNAPNGGYTKFAPTQGYLWTWNVDKQSGHLLTWWKGHEGIPELEIEGIPESFELEKLRHWESAAFKGVDRG
jgi:uncharacterized protein YdaU (DUF1376 family)